jgi:uncharacterized protein involved in outer membrane biogenesis
MQLIIHDLKVSARDEKRHLALDGQVALDGVNGLSITAKGRFDDTPATLVAKAPPVTGRTGPWPFTLALSSPALMLDARGSAPEPLDLAHMSVSLHARGRSLRDLDYIIQAGLFGTQPIDLRADVRHDGRDWMIDRLAGRVGRSRLSGHGTVLKRGGRSKVDATIIAQTFDFDDLSDDSGQAKGARQKARIGPRVIPDTRINLSRVGPTDGVIHFRADHLLLNPGSPFKSLKGDIVLDGKVLRLNGVEAGLSSGRMTGWLQVDSTRPVPVMTTDLAITGSSLEGLLGAGEIIRGPLAGRVRITGRGDTIREAFAHGEGRLGFVATSGGIRRNVADMLGANLGEALIHTVVGPREQVPLRCAVLGFAVRGGVMVPDPVAVDTAVSLGLATGRVSLRDETIAMTMRGQARTGAALKLADPIRLVGTLSSPQIRLGEQGAGVGKAITHALGALFDKGATRTRPVRPPSPRCRRG